MGPAAPLLLATLGLGALLLTQTDKAKAAPPGTTPNPGAGVDDLPASLRGQWDAVLGHLAAGDVSAPVIQAATQLIGLLREAGYEKLAKELEKMVAKARKQMPPTPPDVQVPPAPGFPKELTDKLNQAIATERDPAKLREILKAVESHPSAGHPQMQMAIQMLKALILQLEANKEQNNALEEIEQEVNNPPGTVTSPGQPQPPAYGSQPTGPGVDVTPQPDVAPQPVPEPGKVTVPTVPTPQAPAEPKSPAALAAEGVALNMHALEKSRGVKKAKGKQDMRLVKRFQKLEQMTQDGKPGPGTLKAIGKYVGNLPHVWYWPKGATKQDVLDYRRALIAMASEAKRAGDTLRAQQLIASAARENGEGGIVGTKPPKATPAPTPTPSPAKPAPSPILMPNPKPPSAAVPAPAQPAPAPAVSERLVPDQSSLAGRTAVMLYQSGRGPAKDLALLSEYKKSVGLQDTKLYGPGTGKSLMMRGIVPPTPWDWPAGPQEAVYRKEYRNNLLYMGNVKDKARKAEWHAAASKI